MARRRRPLAPSQPVPTTELRLGYPQIVLRLLPAVYCRLSVVFHDDPLHLGLTDDMRSFRVLDPSTEMGTTLTDERREAVLDGARELALMHATRACAVFGPADAHYLGLSQPERMSGRPPVGGLDMVPLVRRSIDTE